MSVDEITQRVIDLAQAQIAANNGKIDLQELKRGVGLALGWPADFDMDALPPNIARALDKIVNCALFKHGLDQFLVDIAD
jgi:hypothetical protein